MGIKQLLSSTWRIAVFFVIPLAILPFPLVVNTQLAGATYVLMINIIFYILMPIPLAINAMLPVFLYPLLGVHPAGQIATWFMNDPTTLLISSMAFALGIEAVNLHERIALKVLTVLGPRPERLLLAFLIVSGFLSMWISNIAAVVMLLPIVRAVNKDLCEQENNITGNDAVSINSKAVNEEFAEDPPASTKVQKFTMGLVLSIIYGASIGGMSTLIGAHPNIVFKLVMDQIYGDVTGVNFATHMMICTPLGIVSLLIVWLLMTIMYVPDYIKSCCKKQERTPEEMRAQDKLHKNLKGQYEKLGSIRFEEGSVIFFFLFLLMLWFFRSPSVFPGWEIAFKKGYVSDNAPTLLLVATLFVWPRSLKALWTTGKHDPILTWPIMQRRFPWEIFLFACGTNVLSEGSTRGGIAEWTAEQMNALSGIPPWAMMILISLVTAILTEFIGNSTLVTLLLPILATFATQSLVNPIYYLLPAALCTMLSFMTPVAAPITALVYGEKLVTRREMCVTGLIPKITCFILVILFVNTFGDLVYNVHHFPQWANLSAANNASSVHRVRVLNLFLNEPI
ncbi:solute carrier family 13 member 2-like [Paramacrobiotus metropolitanus]|uniref:solute carrier family 13 member 2-like n=1 Tax=Paramacrobiotus metropolitanus TaxID=2943436 RepID=UPI002445B5FC|nr:solute carrier family 13 member 2-like [Paramacrobiotus metropolitanus]